MSKFVCVPMLNTGLDIKMIIHEFKSIEIDPISCKISIDSLKNDINKLKVNNINNIFARYCIEKFKTNIIDDTILYHIIDNIATKYTQIINNYIDAHNEYHEKSKDYKIIQKWRKFIEDNYEINDDDFFFFEFCDWFFFESKYNNYFYSDGYPKHKITHEGLITCKLIK